jgi:hypothetical protein
VAITSAITSCLLLAACAQPPAQQAEAPPSAMCDAFGYPRGTHAYAQCATEAARAQWREARAARARVNCTPMGDQTVCQ